MASNVPRPSPQEQQPPPEQPQRATTAPRERYRLTEQDRNSIREEMRLIKRSIDNNVSRGRSDLERALRKDLENHFERLLEATLTISAQRRALGDEVASSLGNEIESARKGIIGEMERIAGIAGGKVPPSEMLERVRVGLDRNYVSLLIGRRNETPSERKKRERILSFLMASYAKQEESAERAQAPDSQEIAGYISEELPKGDSGYMTYLWMALSITDAAKKAEITQKYIEMLKDDEDAIREFLEEGNRRYVFSPAEMKRFFDGYTNEDLEKFDKIWTELEKFVEHRPPPGSTNIFDNLGREMGPSLLMAWGAAIMGANILTNVSVKGWREGLRSLAKNPFMLGGMAAAGGGAIWGRHERGERRPPESERLERGYGTFRKAWERGDEIVINFMRKAEEHEKGEGGRFFLFLEYAMSGRNKNCEGFLEFLEDKKNLSSPQERAKYEKIIRDFEESIGGRENLKIPRINQSLSFLAEGFRSLHSIGESDPGSRSFQRIFDADGGLEAYMAFLEEVGVTV